MSATDAGSEESVAILVHPDRYLRHLNQVASVTTRHIRVVRRKFLSKTGWQIVDVPLSECTGIRYKDERPLFKVFVGLLLSALTLSICYLLFVYWDRLTPGTRIPAGALVLAAAYGLTWAFRSRRHQLSFFLTDGRTLTWRSTSGDYEYKLISAQRIVQFAGSTGLLASESSALAAQAAARSGN